MDKSNFQQFLDILNQKRIYQEALRAGVRNYKISQFKINTCSPNQINMLFKRSLRKGIKQQNEQNNYSWAQGELKIFVWLIVCYAYTQKLHISQFREQDFHFFCNIFKTHSADFLSYQTKFLLKTSSKASWGPQQVQMLRTIISQKLLKKNWNTIAYELFLQSGKQFFRTPKQCRERWHNHEDPTKNRQGWTHEEGALLMNLVISYGKRWSFIAKKMNLTRTEHMVKNRYTSEIKKMSNIYPKLSEEVLRETLANRELMSQEQSFSDESFRPTKEQQRDFIHHQENLKAKQLKSIKNQQKLVQEKIDFKEIRNQLEELSQDLIPQNLIFQQQLSFEQLGENIQYQEISIAQCQNNHDPFDFFGSDFNTKNSLDFFY